ncbi:transglutaminase domain-containing protein [Paenibacillus sp. LHD-117]|uniref:DUF4129 domain-containing transglutaminase family protein n=1 Tax=Paenibacillus sp. LHD-117 TaxID=3071412 RepID=UPI0027DF439F|nr:transglutaminase domain-containing protein [Paenibacillus sp. LHD-117]MDQ6419057.1 transglutaminase domain-containing protein [Paenibacillus sp. LHD-117]
MKKLASAVGSYLGNAWYERFVSLFVGVILMACLTVFDSYWWPESFTVAYSTLIAAIMIDIILPHRLRMFRWSLQLIAAVWLTFRFARKEWEIAAPIGREEWGWWLEQQLAQLHPFIWISLALLGLHLLFSTWATTRPRLFGIVGAALLVLTVADSFTPIWLWDDVAVVVFTGLFWLVVNHLRKLQLAHPDSWKALFEYPIGLITPTIIVLAILVLIGTNVPSIAPILQDPYTIWKNAQGEEVKVFLGEKAIQSNDTPLSNGNASSGYSREDGQLGGGFDYDFSPMMTVSTSQRSYWRGESKASYTGLGWEDSDDGNASSLQRVTKGNSLDETIDRSKAETVEVSQIVSLIRQDVYPVLFGAAPVSKVNWINEEESEFSPRLVSWFPDEWELLWRDSESYPASYSITSTVTVLNEEGLKGAEASFDDQQLQRMYTELPDTLPNRVRELAEEVSSGGASDYEKARLIEEYLRTNFVYNNKPDLSKLTGESNDFVDQFLFELKEGYCDYFSSAMAVLARSLDMPARWVKGFAPGVLPADRYGPGEMLEGEDFNPSGAGMYTVRNSDAHSWVEIYFEGYGWISFEATAGFSFPYMMPQEEDAPLPSTSPTEQEPMTGTEKTGSTDSSIWQIVALSVIVAGAALWLIVRRRDIPVMWNKLRGRSYSANEQIVVETNKLLRQCQKRGLRREEHETLREAIMRWSKYQSRLGDDFRYVLDSFEHAKYSQVAVTREEAERFAGKVRYLIGELK